jgi:fatty acid synthase
LYQDLPKLLDNTFLTLSLHLEHDALYEKNAVMASTDAELAELVGIVRKEWHGVDLDVWEGGSGSCGFTRRVVPLVEGQLAQYTCSDISAIRLGTLAGHPSIKSAKHDLNFPIEGATGKHHLVLANNAIHTAGNVKKTLAYFRDALTEGGFVLLEEQITDACLYLWGLDDFIWTTVDEDLDPRSYGLWMAWSEWLATIQATQGLELLAWHRSDYHVTMLLRKTSSPKPAAPVQASWSDVAALNAAAASNGDSQGAPTQVLRGAGADGLVKTLRLEEGNYALQALVDLDGSAAQANLSGESLALPLNFTHVQGGKAGSLVVVPAAAWQAGQAHKAAVAQARADVTAKPAAAAATSAVAAGGNVQLHIMRPGDLSTLAWIEARATPEYQVSVAYSSLNFKDIMYAFGKLRLEKPSFGLEFSGTVGPDQSPVMGIGTSSCIALKTMPTLCWPVPDGMSLEAAATVPVVYATALFSLFEKARLEKGHTALIHAGTGGVGHAAIYLCQARGIEVFATCGDAKRQYLKDTFGLDDAHIGNSRDTSFREVVYRGTNGEGVDCVLNSLSGSLLDASLQCVKAYGHFCEIGKYDLQNNTPVGLKAFEANVSYHAIDLAAMFTHPRLSLVLQKLLADALAAGEVTPLPAAVYEASQVEAALRFMSAGKHRGKVLVRMSGFNPTTAVTAAPVEAFAASSSSSSLEAAAAAAPEVLPRFNTTGTHLITGGTGGFGMELAGWLMTHGAKKVVVTSRSGLTSGWQRYRADALEAQFGAGCLELSSLDVVNPQQCGELLTLCDGTGDKKGELKGVWHVAMVLQDVLFKNMTPEKWNTCNAVKVNGLENLDASCRQLLPSSQLDCFVAFSSVSSLFGNVGQANYAYANAACETVVLQRNAAGLKGVAVQWGMIDNVGFFGSHDAKVLETFLGFQNIDASMASLHELLPMGGVVTSYRLAATAKGGNDDGAAFELSVPTIQAKFAEILGGKAGDYDPEAALNDYGLDSLSSIEVVNWMNRHTTSSVNPSFMTADMTINKMHAFMAANSKSE